MLKIKMKKGRTDLKAILSTNIKVRNGNKYAKNRITFSPFYEDLIRHLITKIEFDYDWIRDKYMCQVLSCGLLSNENELYKYACDLSKMMLDDNFSDCFNDESQERTKQFFYLRGIDLIYEELMQIYSNMKYEFV